MPGTWLAGMFANRVGQTLGSHLERLAEEARRGVSKGRVRRPESGSAADRCADCPKEDLGSVFLELRSVLVRHWT